MSTRSRGRSCRVNSELHLNLLERTDRLYGIREALRRVISPSSRVLDAGCGSGLLSIWAAQLGAMDVIGVDSDSVDVAQELAIANGVRANVRFVSADLFNESSSELIGDRNVIVAMLFLNDPRRDERQIEIILSLRKRHLTASGVMIPSRVVTRGRLLEWPDQDYQSWLIRTQERTHRLSNLYGVDLSPLHRSIAAGTWHSQFPARNWTGRYPGAGYEIRTEAVEAYTVDLHRGEFNPPSQVVATATSRGAANTLLWVQEIWFEDILLFSNESISWLEHSVWCEPGQPVEMKLGKSWRDRNVIELGG